MRALVFRGPWDLAVEDRPDPSPGPEEVLLRVIATGICGSDVHGFTGENGRRKPGQVMGHETVGRVVALGDGVHGVAEGALATVFPVLGCEDCDACRADRRQSCASRRVIGVTPDIPAAFAEYLLVPQRAVVPLADGTPVEYGALVEPLAVGYHAVRRGGCTSDDAVLVIGGGPIGQAVALAARRLGVGNLVVSEPAPHRRKLCDSLGVDSFDPTGGGGAREHALAALGGPADVVVDAVGSSHSLADAFGCSAIGATVVLVGMHSPGVEIPAYAVSTEERTLLGSFCYSRREFDETAAWVGTAPPELDLLVEGRVGLEEAPSAFAALARGDDPASKVLVLAG